MHRILVIGETCVDKFVYGSVARICPEAPVPVFVPDPSKTVRTLGMASNVQRNIAAISTNSHVFRADIITNSVTPVKTRFVDHKSNHMIMRVDENDVIHEKINIKNIDFDKYEAVVVSDYNKGFITESDLQEISFAHPLTFIDTKKPLKHFCINYSFIKINEPEFNYIPDNTKSMMQEIEKNLIVTMSERGCRYNGKNYPVEEISGIFDISGAGDTFLAGLVCKYLMTKDIDQALQYANECARNVVCKKGVSTI